METRKKALTLAITCVSCLLVYLAYNHYEKNPATRHAIVKADIIKIAPEISGKIVTVSIRDNAPVQKGDLLFEIDPKPFIIAKKGAEIHLAKAYQGVDSLEKQIIAATASVAAAKTVYLDALKNAKRNQNLFQAKSISEKRLDDSIKITKEAKSRLEAQEALLQEKKIRLGEMREENISVAAAKVNLEKADLHLSYTKVYAPADGFAVNVSIHPGDYAVAGHPVLAVVDSASIHVMAALKETQLQSVTPGAKARIRLMTESGTTRQGVVESVGKAINPREYRSADSIVPTIPAAFDWVRLAQRVPVKISFLSTDEKALPIPGTTASVSIMTDENGND